MNNINFFSIRSHEPEGWTCCGRQQWASGNCSLCGRPDPRYQGYGQ